jgi:hypothetical protein
MNNNKYLIDKANEIKVQSNKVKENLDNIDNLISQRKHKIKKEDFYYKLNLLNFFLFAIIVYYYYYNYFYKKEEIFVQEEKKIIKFFKKLTPFMIKSKIVLAYSLIHNGISIIIFQYLHIHKLQNIIKALVLE